MADDNAGKLLEKYKFEQEAAEEYLIYATKKTEYPKPEFRNRIVVESVSDSIEQAYFWIIDHLKYDWGYTNFIKITDVFAASEQSAFFGVSEQRLATQQEKAATYLRGISEMVKALFQIIRELRIIDERRAYYIDTMEEKSNAMSSEITLKGVWIDQVEGGVKNAASVYGLAQSVGFTILPDLFFRIRVKDMNNLDQAVDAAVDKLEFNEKVKEVLKRKLRQFYEWKKRTYDELTTRRKFIIKYLRQHYETIKLYMGWIKPYLRNIRRLQLDQKKLDSAEMITAFEGSMVEIEVLAKKEDPAYRKFYPCILIHFNYRTKPYMHFTGEGYQRGPIHKGKFDMTMRGYVWSNEHIENYTKMKEEEDLQLMSMINESIKESMDALGDELKHYLMEGGESFDIPKKPKPKGRPGITEPFEALFGGFKDLAGSFGGSKDDKPRKASEDRVATKDEIDKARKTLKTDIYQTYKNYKKMHGMLTWA
ncbi:hypothetical protein HYY72_05565 [Candidatus Woesearchaeota archaeon]|nr:hypothetical protein [Candidatus Woesearchaeota archaeon]